MRAVGIKDLNGLWSIATIPIKPVIELDISVYFIGVRTRITFKGFSRQGRLLYKEEK